jgi:DNA polymerase III subunit epsilon
VNSLPLDVQDHESDRGALGAHAEAAAVARLWAGVRLVVVDTETVIADGERRAVSVSVAVVTCRAGLLRGKWQTLVHADVPVDPDSGRTHGLTDEHFAREPSFAEIADTLRSALTAATGETVVFVAHYAGVLRAEFERIGEEVSDLPSSTPLAGSPLVGVRTGNSLADLAAALGVAQARPHDALDDAQVCAEAVTELINRAAGAGETDFGVLLGEVGHEHTNLTVPAVCAAAPAARSRCPPTTS